MGRSSGCRASKLDERTGKENHGGLTSSAGTACVSCNSSRTARCNTVGARTERHDVRHDDESRRPVTREPGVSTGRHHSRPKEG